MSCLIKDIYKLFIFILLPFLFFVFHIVQCIATYCRRRNCAAFDVNYAQLALVQGAGIWTIIWSDTSYLHMIWIYAMSKKTHRLWQKVRSRVLENTQNCLSRVHLDSIYYYWYLLKSKYLHNYTPCLAYSENFNRNFQTKESLALYDTKRCADIK